MLVWYFDRSIQPIMRGPWELEPSPPPTPLLPYVRTHHFAAVRAAPASHVPCPVSVGHSSYLANNGNLFITLVKVSSFLLRLRYERRPPAAAAPDDR